MNDLKTGRLLTHWATRTVEVHRGESSFLLQKKQGVVTLRVWHFRRFCASGVSQPGLQAPKAPNCNHSPIKPQVLPLPWQCLARTAPSPHLPKSSQPGAAGRWAGAPSMHCWVCQSAILENKSGAGGGGGEGAIKAAALTQAPCCNQGAARAGDPWQRGAKAASVGTFTPCCRNGSSKGDCPFLPHRCR